MRTLVVPQTTFSTILGLENDPLMLLWMYDRNCSFIASEQWSE